MMAKTYLYRIGYYSYEDSGVVVLSHKRKISKREYRNMFVEATLELLLNRRDVLGGLRTDEGEYHEFEKERYTDDTYTRVDGKEYATLEEFLEERETKNYTRFSNIYRAVAVIMVEMYGFEFVEYEQDEWVDGWGAICDKDRSFGEDDILLNRIMKKFWARKKKK